MVDDAVEREHDVVVEREFGNPNGAGAALVVDAGLGKAERGDGPPEIGFGIADAAKLFDDAAADEPEVSGVTGDGVFREEIHEPVEHFAGDGPALGFESGLADAVDYVGSLAPVGKKHRDHLRRVLQVAIQLDGCGTAGSR
jgi:hypothetical protein